MFSRKRSVESQRSRWRLFIWLVPLTIWVGFPLVAWIFWERGLAEKVLTEFLMPVGLAWNLLLLIWVIHWWGGTFRLRTWGWFLAFAAWTIAASPIFSSSLVRAVEAPWLTTVAKGHYDYVAVLGGGVSVDFHGNPQVSGDGQRAIEAVEMFHAKQTDAIIALGGMIKGISVEPASGTAPTRELMMNLQVPAEAIHEVEGKNTLEEVRAIKAFLEERGALEKRTGLITSAFHMTRAMRLANATGLEVEPIPTAIRTSPPRVVTPLDLVPSSDALRGQQMVWKEQLARFFGR